jgi:hypothetical protein
LPADFKHVLDPHLFGVSVIRYLAGTLIYDEILFATPARLGLRIGAYISDIWVDDRASVWGGRRIWGLPKNLAKFAWNDSTVNISDDHGLIAKISVDASPSRSPLLWAPIPGFGRLEQGWTFYIGSMWAHFGKSDMQILEWPARFDAIQNTRPAFSFAARPFDHIQVPPPRILKAPRTP